VNSPDICDPPKGRCAELAFRLAIYEAGHALVARALGLKIHSLRMLPRPPVLLSEKAFRGRDWASFSETLEIRIMELFGGQIAEEIACGSNTCCSGDVARIDELTRLLAGLGDPREPEDIWFDLEDRAHDILSDPPYEAAIIKLAEFLHERVLSGYEIIDGPVIEDLLNNILPPRRKENRVRRFFGLGQGKQRLTAANQRTPENVSSGK